MAPGRTYCTCEPLVYTQLTQWKSSSWQPSRTYTSRQMVIPRTTAKGPSYCTTGRGNPSPFHARDTTPNKNKIKIIGRWTRGSSPLLPQLWTLARLVVSQRFASFQSSVVFHLSTLQGNTRANTDRGAIEGAISTARKNGTRVERTIAAPRSFFARGQF